MNDQSRRVCSTIVRVRDLRLLADVGINPDEIGRRQPLIISMDVTLDVDEVHNVEQTLDYRKLAAAAEELALIHIPLIETFALRLAKQCLAMRHAATVVIKIDKPFALTRGLAGVELEMRNGASMQAGQSGEQT